MSIPPEHDNRFRGKHIIITGAGGNFGREGCIYFGLRGAKISALDLNKDTLSETEALLKSTLGSDAAPIQCFECNVTDPESVKFAIDGAVKEYGVPHMLWSKCFLSFVSVCSLGALSDPLFSLSYHDTI